MRTVRIGFRLEAKAHPISIPFSEQEAEYVRACASHRGLSAGDFVRSQVCAAAGGLEHSNVQLAAANAGLPLSQWVRILSLSAAGYLSLPSQIERAHRV